MTFRSNTNTNAHEKEAGTYISLFPHFRKNNDIVKKKNLIEKLYECKLSLFGSTGCYTLQSERGGIKLISTLSDITVTV